MSYKNLKVVCFGEILFDVFLKHKKIGGAALNVTSRLKLFGVDSTIISAVGDDDNGKKIVTYFENLGIPTNSIQIKENYPTGVVNVSLNGEGSASYNIAYPSAWDKICLSIEDIKLVRNANLFVFGSLASRNELTKKTLLQLLKVAKHKVFDVNLRKPHYCKETLVEFMDEADFIKFNDEELYEISRLMGSNFSSIEQNIKFISKQTPILSALL